MTDGTVRSFRDPLSAVGFQTYADSEQSRRKAVTQSYGATAVEPPGPTSRQQAMLAARLVSAMNLGDVCQGEARVA